MTAEEIGQSYRDYVACLNCWDWAVLNAFVHKDVRRNGCLLGLSGYSAMLKGNCVTFPT